MFSYYRGRFSTRYGWNISFYTANYNMTSLKKASDGRIAREELQYLVSATVKFYVTMYWYMSKWLSFSS